MNYNLYNTEDLDALVNELVTGDWAFERTDDTYEAVSTVILHAPPDMGSIDVDYVGNRVAKMLANKIAYDKIQELKEKRKQEDTAKAAQAAEVASNGPVQNIQVQGA